MTTIKRHRCGTVAIEGDISACPGCGAASVNGTSFHLQPQEASLLMRLALSDGWLTKRELIEWIYDRRQDGGALSADVILRNKVWQINIALRELGLPFSVVSWRKVGYRLDQLALNEEAA